MIQQKQGNLDIHQYYMDILNCMPNIVYWVDLDCKFQGCNLNFVKLLGLKRIKDFSGTPYETMEKWLPWTKARIESLKLNDMSVLFSGTPEYDIEEAPVFNTEGAPIYYQVTRVPLLDTDQQVIGLVVVLVDITAQKAMQTLLNHAEPVTEFAMTTERLDTPLRVLIVEDNLTAQNVEKALLVALNCIVDVAESGDAAATLFAPGRYSLVFMDISLGDTSGYMVSKTLRKMEENTDHHVPIIALTSHQADVVKYDCHDYDMEGVLTKPLTHEQALQIIKHYVYHEKVVVDGLRSI